jgi:hypothetical protein
MGRGFIKILETWQFGLSFKIISHIFTDYFLSNFWPSKRSFRETLNFSFFLWMRFWSISNFSKKMVNGRCRELFFKNQLLFSWFSKLVFPYSKNVMACFLKQKMFFISKSMPWHLYCTEKRVSKVMKTVIDFKKIVPDLSRSPFSYWKLIYSKKASIKKN